MCILCVVQKWSRRVATMLPWLVIPLIGLWALSQLLPPGFRFEVTSPRLACVLVLLVTIFWYEILMPQLSAWRERRNALNREKKRYEAIEREKLRKTATRLCRNCLSPYKDQNPSGGRFTCSYCGHVSKRPALDLSGFGMDETKISGSGVFENLVTKSAGKTPLNGKVRYNCRGKDGGDDRCSDFFVCNKLASFLLSIRWARIKSFVLGLLADNDSLNREFDEIRKGDNQLNFGESKGEKARRKAEEKRQARLEREQLEEEERKQREEVAKLVEERRKLKDVYMPPEKECGKGSAHDKRKDGKKEAEKKRQERRKEKDIGSSKSNSDVEDLDKKSGKESEKKTENERRDISKSASANTKFNTSDNGTKAVTRNNFSRVAGAKYLERVKGSILSSSKAFNGSGFFGKGAQSSANFTIKANKPNGSVDFVQSSVSWNSPDQMPRKSLSNGGDKTTEAISHIPVVSEIKSQTTPKKSWQQLFTRTQADPISSNANAHAHAHANAIATTNANAISRSEQNTQAVDQSPKFAGPVSPTHPLDNQTYFTRSSPFTHPSFPNASISTTPIFSSVPEPSFPMSGKLSHEEPEIFEDPCYIPDAISLLGPVSESLDNFPLDPLAGFVTDTGPSLYSLQNAPASAEINRPSPIEAPMSRLKVAEERRTNCSQNPFTQSSHDVRTSFVNDSSTKREQGTWQMWNTPSIGQDGLGLVGGTDSWLLPLGQNPSKQESFTYSSPNMGVISEFGTENLLPVTSSPKTVHFSDCQDGGTFSPLGLRNEMMYGSPSRSATTHPYELSAANGWFKDDSTVHASVESAGNSTLGRPYNGGLFNAPDVQSFWSSN